MRKLIAVIALSFAFLAAGASASQIAPPTCGDSCPWVKIAPPTCGDSCPWVKIAPPTCGDSCPWVK